MISAKVCRGRLARPGETQGPYLLAATLLLGIAKGAMREQYDPDFSPEEQVEIENEEAEIHQRYWNELSAFGEAERQDSADTQTSAPTEFPLSRRPRELRSLLRCYAAELAGVEAKRYQESQHLQLWLIQLCERVFDAIWDSVSQIENLTYHSSDDSLRSAIWEPLEEMKDRCRQGLPFLPESFKKTVRRSTSISKAARRKLVDDFIARIQFQAGRKISRTDIWKVAGYRDATEFERFQRGERVTVSANDNFSRVLRMTPESFTRSVDKIKSKK
jgi:hypothetical protein